jgi:caa(3)-type oxidase subunit IV
MPSRLALLGIWAVLQALLGLSLLLGERRSGLANLAIGLLMALLIGWFDMHLRRAPVILRLLAGGVMLWLVIMFGLALPDWLTR